MANLFTSEKRLAKRPLSIPDILAWADDYRLATGKWPTQTSGGVATTKFESWSGVNRALQMGLRGLPGGSSLAQLLAEQRGARNLQDQPPLTAAQILSWADAHQRRTGSWPNRRSGIIPDSGGEKWVAIECALRQGNRGLPGGTSLARLLAEHRGVRNAKQLPALAEKQILAWADAHHQRTGAWPMRKSGPVLEAPGETWTAIDLALKRGRRGLPGRSSLALLLADSRGRRHKKILPDFSLQQILTWADACHARTGSWPNVKSGLTFEVSQDTWNAVDKSLRNGGRGLPGGMSLAGLLAVDRGVRNQVSIPRLDRKRILAWARAYWQRTQRWPTKTCGPIIEAPGDTWLAVDAALREGCRGLKGGSSLARLLTAHGVKRNHLDLPPLSKKKILAWADAHHAHTGQWPNSKSGPVLDAPAETWGAINEALQQGHRGQPGGSSLLRLLVKKRGIRHRLQLPPLTEEQILRWADLHCRRAGAWPQCTSGSIADSGGETWVAVNGALRQGRRGLPGGSSLAKLLADKRQEKVAGLEEAKREADSP